mgnify:CR=1 FL=1
MERMVSLLVKVTSETNNISCSPSNRAMTSVILDIDCDMLCSHIANPSMVMSQVIQFYSILLGENTLLVSVTQHSYHNLI